MRHLFALGIFLCTAGAAAAQTPVGNTQEPVTIEASNQLEWLRAENKYRATQDVVITQGTTIIHGDTAEASYDAAKGPSAIMQITVNGNVTITQGAQTATADTALYDVAAQQVTLSGGDVKLTAPDTQVLAHGTVQYQVSERKATAAGGVTVTQKQQTLKAQAITAWFDKDNKLTRAVADKNVVMTQQTTQGPQVAQAQHADYDAGSGKVTLTGDVKLARGTNYMQGAKASVDLKTGYSSLQNDPARGSRVRAIFTPGGGEPTSLPQQAIAVPMVPGKKNPQEAY